jgi:hypothetical protein
MFGFFLSRAKKLIFNNNMFTVQFFFSSKFEKYKGPKSNRKKSNNTCTNLGCIIMLALHIGLFVCIVCINVGPLVSHELSSIDGHLHYYAGDRAA